MDLQEELSMIKTAVIVDRNRKRGLKVRVWINEILASFELAASDLGKLVSDLIWMGKRHPAYRVTLYYHDDGSIVITF